MTVSNKSFSEKLKIIFIALLLIAIPSLANAGQVMLCLKHVVVMVTSLTPDAPIQIADRVKKRIDKITLRINVNCKSGAILVPKTTSEAKDWLVLALPYDFRPALILTDPYIYTQYGYSAEYDLYNYFTKIWKLTPNSPVCKMLPTHSYQKKGINWCFYNLIDSIRRDYKNQKPVLPVVPSN